MQEGYTLTVCGVLVGRAACAEDKLFWWLERELENKIKHRSKQHKFFSQKQDLPGLAIIKVNPIPEIAWLGIRLHALRLLWQVLLLVKSDLHGFNKL